MKLHKLIQTTTVLPGGQRKVNLGNKDKQYYLLTIAMKCCYSCLRFGKENNSSN